MKNTVLICLLFFLLSNRTFGQMNRYQIVTTKNGHYKLVDTQSQKTLYRNCKNIQPIEELKITDSIYKRFLIINTSQRAIVIFDKITGKSIEKIPKCDRLYFGEIYTNEVKSQVDKPKKVIYGVTHSKSNWIDDYAFLFNVETTETRGLFKNKYYFKYDPYHQWIFVKSRDSVVVLNEDLKMIFPTFQNFTTLSNGLSYGNLASNRLWGVIHPDKSILVPFEYCALQPLNDSTFFAVNEQKQVGVITAKNEVIVPFIYQCLQEGYSSSPCACLQIMEPINKTYYQIRMGEEKVILNSDFQPILNVNKASSIKTVNQNKDWIWEETTKGLGIYDIKNNRQILPAIYDYIFLDNEYALVDKNDKMSIICLADSTPVTAFIYEAKYKRYNVDGTNYFIVQKNGRKGVITSDNTEKVPFELDDISLESGYLLVKKNGVYGLMNKATFELILPIEFSEINLYRSTVKKYRDAEIMYGTFTNDGTITWSK